MKRVGLILVIPFLTVSAAQPADVDDTSPQAEPKKGYVKRVFTAGSAVMAGAGAAISQGTNTPGEWGQGAGAFGKRFANSFGKHLIQRTIQYPIARLLHEEISYRRSEKTGFKPRLMYALTSVVITHKTTTGQRTVNAGEIAGSVGSGLISRLWQPASTRTVAMGFGSAGISLGVDAGINVVREFWPEIRHPHRHANPPVPPSVATDVVANNPPTTDVAEVVAIDENGQELPSEPVQ